MGTRAVYTFIDADDSFSVYMHWDGYPRCACRFIAKALPLAWPLPRFEADEFAAAFVAANKQQAGNIRLTSGPDAPGDLAYTYEISCRDGQLHVRINEAGYRLLFEGTLEAACEFAATSN
jgi:hypothetical protein